MENDEFCLLKKDAILTPGHSHPCNVDSREEATGTLPPGPGATTALKGIRSFPRAISTTAALVVTPKHILTAACPRPTRPLALSHGLSPQRMTDKCFRKCIGKPGGSLDNSEQKCIAMCMDRYMDAWNTVSRAYNSRLQRERANM
nr:PREDICTED: mitochondrial import inner membrane translocase subunit Tim13 [Struthio camelus australis]